MVLMSSLVVIFFFSGWLSPIEDFGLFPGEFWFAIKTTFFCFMFIFVRANSPRFRYDQLMSIG
jgi:NADH-quinone oxidoreductase subunit H